MSTVYQYHQPNAPDSHSEDSNSDLDLNLEELENEVSGSGLESHSARTDSHNPVKRWTNATGGWTNRQIPLRNLRRGRNQDAGRHHPELSRGGENDNHGSLSQEHNNSEESHGSFSLTEDDAPLLSNKAGRNVDNNVSGDANHSAGAGLGSLTAFFSRCRKLGGVGRDLGNTNDERTSRSIAIGQYQSSKFSPNAVSNAKYNAWSFLPLTLYNEFSFFTNLYFLLVALSQIIPPLRIGYLSTYVAPLAFVLVITLGKEALDDIARRKRDADANKAEYTVFRYHDVSQGSSPTAKSLKSSRLRLKRPKGSIASSKQSRLDAIEEEEEMTGNDHQQFRLGNIEIDQVEIKSRDLKVGDVLRLNKDQRVPADLVILKSYAAESSITSAPRKAEADISASADTFGTISEAHPIANTSNSMEVDSSRSLRDEASPSMSEASTGETFIRTDQLDGETDWKLRTTSPLSQSLDPREFMQLTLVAAKPDQKVNDFFGTIKYTSDRTNISEAPNGSNNQNTSTSHSSQTASLTIDNTAWANTVIASNATVLAVVVYTGPETKQAMSTTISRSKIGLLDREINNLSKILCAFTLTLSIILVALEGFESRNDRAWYVSIMRFLILFSTIIPISLRVNLDMGKSVYAWFIEKDQEIPGTVVRTSTIPEELGRIEYLLSDKTGTLTQNEMELKKIHVGTVSYANEAMEEVISYIRQGFTTTASPDVLQATSLITPSSTYLATAAGTSTTRTRREIGSRVRDLVLALALCHNVTPTTEEENGHSVTTYQASSPDEIAILRWTESVGLRLVHRDRHTITLQSVDSSRVVVRVNILQVFPFTSEGKRMGIIVQFSHGSEPSTSSTDEAEEIWFYQKGADTVMTAIVAANDWLDEETANMAREGLRTLVVGRRKLSSRQYHDFASEYQQASLSLQNRDISMNRVVNLHLEKNLELLGVTGVEDKLQANVKSSLELLRNAGIKIWMLTGDKVETARCVAVSAKLVSRSQYIHTITNLAANMDPSEAVDALSVLRSKPDSTALLIDGSSLSYLLTHHQQDFISLAVQLPAVIACRCSPTQKADVATLIRNFTHKRVACIGDGGNDVSMIQAADVGIGIVGKEGRQASLAADFSVTQFHHLTKLLVWHGRNSYKRSAKLAQFIIHRGLIISICQTMYSIATQFEPHALYRDWLLVGYATVYTTLPVFSLVLDRDVDEALANLYPELYKELTSGSSLSYRTFFTWVVVSVYQGAIIQGLSQILVHSVDSARMVSVSFTVLVINELIMVALEVVTWHWLMTLSLIGTALTYLVSVPFLGGYFELAYVWSLGFAWRVVAISTISLVPPYAIKLLRRTLRPPSYRKVQGI